MNRDKDELIGKHIAERRRTRRLVGSVLVIMAVLIIVAAAGAVVARDQRDEAISQRAEAIRQKREADDQARVAISRAVAAASQDTAQSDRDLSLLLAVESLRSSPTLEARDSLLGALVEEPYVVQYLRGAPAAVTALGLSGDGSQLFSGHEDGRVLAWDLAEPRPTPTHLLTGVGSIRGLAVDRTGARLVVASDELGVVDMSRDDAPVQILAGPALSDALVLSVDGRLLVNTGCSPRTDGCFEGKVKVWDLDARRVVSSWVWNAGSVTSAAVSSDSKPRGLGSYRGDVATIRLKTGEVDDFTGTAPHPDQVESLVFTADDHRLVSASGTATPIPENPSARAEPTVRTWNVKSGARVRDVTLPWQSEGANPFDIALAPDGKMIATAGDHTIVKLWDAQTGSLISEFPGHHSLVGDLVFSASGLQMVSGDQDGLLIRWATSPVIAAAGNRAMVRLPSATRTLSTEFSPDGTRVAVGGFEAVQLWDLATGTVVQDLEPVPPLGVESLAFSPDGTTVIAGAVDGDVIEGVGSYSATRGNVMAWDAATGQPRTSPIPMGEWVYEVAYSPAGDLVAVGGGGPLGDAEGAWVALIDPTSWSLLKTLSVGEGSVTSVAFGHDGRTLAAGTSNGTVAVWQQPSSSSRPLTIHLDEDEGISAVAFSPDDEMMALGQATGVDELTHTIHLADPITGQLLGDPLVGHPGRDVTGLGFNSDGTLLVSSGGNRSGDPTGELSIWNVADRSLHMSTLRVANEEVADLALDETHEGLRVAAADQAGVLLWDLDVGSWQQRACDVAGRDLTNEEWTALVGSFLPYESTC